MISIDHVIELAVIRGADRALRRAAARAEMRATQTIDGAAVAKHLRDAATWSACADDVAALKGPTRPQDEPDAVRAPVDRPRTGQGGAGAPMEVVA